MTNNISDQPGPTSEPDNADFLTPDQAEPILHEAIASYLEDGWETARWANYMVRLRRDDRILDVQVDLQGQVKVEEKRAVQTAVEVGRLIAWVILLVALLLSLTLASILGFLD